MVYNGIRTICLLATHGCLTVERVFGSLRRILSMCIRLSKSTVPAFAPAEVMPTLHAYIPVSRVQKMSGQTHVHTKAQAHTHTCN